MHEKSHIKFMREAIKEARKGYEANEVPVGAVIVKDGKIISRSHSLVKKMKDPTVHAEILAIKKAFNEDKDRVIRYSAKKAIKRLGR